MKEAWVVFDDGRWWTKHFLKKGFGHLFVIGRDKYNWFMFNPLTYGLGFKILPFEASEDVIKTLRKSHKNIVYLRYSEKNDQSFLSLFKPTNCVEMIKYILGLKVKGYTPYAFFKQLVNMQKTNKYPININEVKLLI